MKDNFGLLYLRSHQIQERHKHLLAFDARLALVAVCKHLQEMQPMQAGHFAQTSPSKSRLRDLQSAVEHLCSLKGCMGKSYLHALLLHKLTSLPHSSSREQARLLFCTRIPVEQRSAELQLTVSIEAGTTKRFYGEDRVSSCLLSQPCQGGLIRADLELSL